MESILFKEMIETLNDHVVILSKEDEQKIVTLFESKVPLLFFKVNWQKIKKHIEVKSEHDMIASLNSLLGNSIFNDTVYVFWNDADLPTIKTDLQSIVNNFDHVLPVGFETFLFNPDQNYIIECTSGGMITMGLLE